jgi:hypothetical protein
MQLSKKEKGELSNSKASDIIVIGNSGKDKFTSLYLAF